MSMTWVFILRLVVAGLLGTVVGIEREWRVKEAGFRTHFLVSLGSALFMIIAMGLRGVPRRTRRPQTRPQPRRGTGR